MQAVKACTYFAHVFEAVVKTNGDVEAVKKSSGLVPILMSWKFRKGEVVSQDYIQRIELSMHLRKCLVENGEFPISGECSISGVPAVKNSSSKPSSFKVGLLFEWPWLYGLEIQTTFVQQFQMMPCGMSGFENSPCHSLGDRELCLRPLCTMCMTCVCPHFLDFCSGGWVECFPPSG